MPRKRSFKKIKAQLEARRGELLGALSLGLAQSKTTTLYRTMDSPEMASASTDNDMVFQFVEMESEELDQIDEALERLEDGTYGQCEACDEPIGQGRLEAIPSTTLCIKCKAAIEAGELDLAWTDAARWERLDAFEQNEADVMVTAMDRGEKVG